MADSGFKRRVRREVNLRIREMRDGCNECRACRGLCTEHYKAAVELILHPKRALKLKG